MFSPLMYAKHSPSHRVILKLAKHIINVLLLHRNTSAVHYFQSGTAGTGHCIQYIFVRFRVDLIRVVGVAVAVCAYSAAVGSFGVSWGQSLRKTVSWLWSEIIYKIYSYILTSGRIYHDCGLK